LCAAHEALLNLAAGDDDLNNGCFGLKFSGVLAEIALFEYGSNYFSRLVASKMQAPETCKFLKHTKLAFCQSLFFLTPDTKLFSSRPRSFAKLERSDTQLSCPAALRVLPLSRPRSSVCIKTCLFCLDRKRYDMVANRFLLEGIRFAATAIFLSSASNPNQEQSRYTDFYREGPNISSANNSSHTEQSE
jgi:hypothetical protein